MTKRSWLMVILIASGCNEVRTRSCKATCSTDSDCPSGLVCGDLGLCAAEGETCSCEPGEFIACDGDNALFCNAEANGVTSESCGASGCNGAAKRCNACIPETIACSADGTTLDQCDRDGVVAHSEACPAGCLSGADGGADRCGYIDPVWLSGICDEPAAKPEAILSDALDVQQDSACTGGVVEREGTKFCVVRAGRIEIGDLKVTGTRAIAFVADGELTVSGTLDVSADGRTPGPGAGVLGAGPPRLNSSYKGGGGAGFAQAGGGGGGNETGTEAGTPGGPITDRPITSRFVGGATAASAICGEGTILCLGAIDFPGGGGGGGALLVACRGTVRVTGLIDAGGGGGSGGGDHYPASGTIAQGGAPGGGSGGFVVFQGARVEITGKLYANGGGGGAGCGTDNCRGLPGADGLRGTTGAPGGDPPGNTGGGGIGGSVSNTPGFGEPTFSAGAAGAGGGGGSVGRFLVFTPSGVTPVLTPAEASPVPEASSTSLLVK